MYIRSTGLGRTLLRARISGFDSTKLIPTTMKKCKNNTETTRLLLTVETEYPVTWTISTFMEPEDLRAMIRFALRPSTIFTMLKFLFIKGPEKVSGTEDETSKKENANSQDTSAQPEDASPGTEKKVRASVPLSPAQKAALIKKEKDKERQRQKENMKKAV